MRIKKLTPEIKAYLIKMYGLYESNKLTYGEEKQLFQDLSDSGLCWQMGPEVTAFTQKLLRHGLILPAPNGKENAN